MSKKDLETFFPEWDWNKLSYSSNSDMHYLMIHYTNNIFSPQYTCGRTPDHVISILLDYFHARDIDMHFVRIMAGSVMFTDTLFCEISVLTDDGMINIDLTVFWKVF